MIFTAHYHSPTGELLLAEQDGKLTGSWFLGQKYFPNFPSGSTQEREHSPLLQQAARWLDCYFAGERPAAAEIPLAPLGSGFRKEVWRLLCEIPYGETVTYGEIAQKLAARCGLAQMSAQAVGGAVAHNPISIFIPCHRVVGSNGSLTGYAGGLQTKLKLLVHEGVNTEPFRVPGQDSWKSCAPGPGAAMQTQSF